YGKTKLAGEIAIQQACSDYIILRTAWVYGTYGKSNFVKTMLRLGKEKPEIRVVADQIGTPTWSQDIALTISQIIPQLTAEITGIYHYTNSGVASWYDFAIAIFEEAEKLGFKEIYISKFHKGLKQDNYAIRLRMCGKIEEVFSGLFG
ncbi:MAG: SDR family oxidoreductase, partial [Dolichospermum sp.]